MNADDLAVVRDLSRHIDPSWQSTKLGSRSTGGKIGVIETERRLIKQWQWGWQVLHKRPYIPIYPICLISQIFLASMILLSQAQLGTSRTVLHSLPLTTSSKVPHASDFMKFALNRFVFLHKVLRVSWTLLPRVNASRTDDNAACASSRTATPIFSIGFPAPRTPNRLRPLKREIHSSLRGLLTHRQNSCRQRFLPHIRQRWYSILNAFIESLLTSCVVGAK